MKNSIIAEYTERVFAYALKRTFSYDEAEELSQEILVTAIKELPKLKNEESFEPWLWGIAGNVAKTFSRRMGKQRAMFSYDVPEDIAYEEDTEDKAEEELSELRAHIAMLSKAYRDIIVFHYYDNLSVKQISEKLGIPTGTVTWRLSEARNKLNKEYNMETTALYPQKLHLSIHGNGNYDGKSIAWPTEFINDSLSQNILVNCYEEAKSIEELAKLCGVPAYYIEERIENLSKREAIVEQSKGKYRTDFAIWSDKYGIYLEENAEKALLPVMDKLIKALLNIAEDSKSIDFYRAGKREEDLFYLYGVRAFMYLKSRFCSLPYPQMKEKYDGFRWCYLGSVETGKHPRLGLSVNTSGNRGSRGNYAHEVYAHFGSLPFRPMMYDYYINACTDIIQSGAAENPEHATAAIREGYIQRKEDGSLFVTVPAFTLAQQDEFFALVEKHLFPLGDEYSKSVEKLLDGYYKLFPKHLQDEARRLCHHMFFGLFSVVVAYAQKKEIIKMPSQGYVCDVLLEFKK